MTVNFPWKDGAGVTRSLEEEGQVGLEEDGRSYRFQLLVKQSMRGWKEFE